MTECVALFNDKLKQMEYVQELIRCKDCRWCRDFSSGAGCDRIGVMVCKNGFCCWAERVCDDNE